MENCPNVIQLIKNKFGQVGGNNFKYYLFDSAKVLENKDLLIELFIIHKNSFNLDNNNYIKSLFDISNQKILLVLFNSKISGFCLINKDNNYLHDLCVKTKFRKNGVGSFILEKAKLHYPNIWLNVEKSTNTTEKLLNFYTKRDFELFDENIRYYSLKYNKTQNKFLNLF